LITYQELKNLFLKEEKPIKSQLKFHLKYILQYLIN